MLAVEPTTIPSSLEAIPGISHGSVGAIVTIISASKLPWGLEVRLGRGPTIFAQPCTPTSDCCIDRVVALDGYSPAGRLGPGVRSVSDTQGMLPLTVVGSDRVKRPDLLVTMQTVRWAGCAVHAVLQGPETLPQVKCSLKKTS